MIGAGLAIVLLGITPTPALAADGPRQAEVSRRQEPWSLELSTRLAARFDSLEGDSGATEVWTIRGASTPELFFPTEIVRVLARTAFATDPERAREFRRVYESRCRRAGVLVPPWSDWVTDMAPLLELLRARDAETEVPRVARARERTEGEPTGVGDVANLPECRATFQSLRALRAAYAPENFDRFLYLVVAPGITISWTAQDRVPLETIRAWEAGCE